MCSLPMLGRQKKEFVDVLRVLLQQVHHLNVFVDEHSLLVGDHAREQMKAKLSAAAVGEWESGHDGCFTSLY